jgi:glycosyltransferase involved in cell wall biosynthesis
MSTISVIIPTYNDGERLLQAVRSAAAQTWPRERMEIIVVDDGSTDGTGERMAQYIASAPLRTRCVRQDNAGPGAARNHGLRLARGDIVAFLDADDRWQPDKLARQAPLLDATVALVYCDASFVDAAGAPLDGYVRRIEMARGDILLPLFCDFFLLTSAVMLSAAAVALVGPFDEQLAVGEDYEFFLRVARRFHADYVAAKLLVRCVRPDSLSRRDYALDARTDLATLDAFLEADPKFAQRHRQAVRRRLARYRYDLAYRLLADRRRGEAIAELLQSLRTQASLGAARTLARALLPRIRVARAPGVAA